jgi:hypothetical protein
MQSFSNKLVEVTIIASVLVIFQITMQLVYGLASSLEKLENESKAELSYRTELDNYIISHNITCCLNFNEMEDDELEAVVKQHMKDCESGHQDYMVRTYGMDTKLDNRTRGEMLAMLGVC